MADEIIRLQDVVKTYKMGDHVVKALDHVNLIVHSGEFLSITGPSGSGKSTLMNILGCLDLPDEGEYILEGRKVNQLKDNEMAVIRNQKIGFIFQNFNLISNLNALENVELPLIYRGWGAKQRREIALACLEQVGLAGYANHLPNQLSGGQQQRVAIARALAGTPPILLADEPTGALDRRTGKEVMDILEKLNTDGHTIILITHDMEVAQRAKRTVRIVDGRLYAGEEADHGLHHIH
jgi:putative ABC transport system ATP-binding protein